MSLYLRFGWCYVLVPSVWVVVCLCTFSLGGVISLYLQFRWCFVFVPSVLDGVLSFYFQLGGVEAQRKNIIHAEGTKT
jgi:hypothetical protein